MKASNDILAPACLVLALLCVVAGFGLLAFGEPEESVVLHRARSQGDEDYTAVLEDKLAEKQWEHRALWGGLLACGGALAVVGFGAMRSSR